MYHKGLVDGEPEFIVFGKLISLQSLFGVEHSLRLLFHTDVMDSGREGGMFASALNSTVATRHLLRRRMASKERYD